MSDAETIIRPVRREDADAVVRMTVALSHDEGGTESPFTADAFRADGFGPAPQFFGFIAERAGAPVGYALGFRDYDTDRMVPGVYMSDLYVHESVRGTGTATALAASLARSGRAWGARAMAWGVLRHNARARRFYAKLGAEEMTGDILCWTPGAQFAALAEAPAPAGLTLRPAEAADAPAVATMLRALLEGLAIPRPEALEVRLAADGFGATPLFEVVLAERDGVCVGYALFWPAYDTDIPGRGTLLSDLYVVPDARRGGAARALMGAVARRSREHGGGFLCWFVAQDNAPARAFYRTVGKEDPRVILCVAAGPAFDRLIGE